MTQATEQNVIDPSKPCETVNTKRAVTLTEFPSTTGRKFVASFDSVFWVVNEIGRVYSHGNAMVTAESVRNVPPAPVQDIDPHRPIEGITLWNQSAEYAGYKNSGAYISVDNDLIANIDQIGNIQRYAIPECPFPRSVHNPNHTIAKLTEFRDKVRAERKAAAEAAKPKALTAEDLVCRIGKVLVRLKPYEHQHRRMAGLLVGVIVSDNVVLVGGDSYSISDQIEFASLGTGSKPEDWRAHPDPDFKGGK